MVKVYRGDREIEDQAILQALEKQRQVGIQAFNDGDTRRRWFSGALAELVEGFIDDPEAGAVNPWHGPMGYLSEATTADIGFTTQVVGAKLRQIRKLTAHESGFLKEYAPGPYKITMLGVKTRAPAWYKPGLFDRFHPAPSDLVHELVEMLQREVQELLDEGVSYIQLDALRYVVELKDVRRRQKMLQAGEDLDQALADIIAADNATLRNARGPGRSIALHMCRATIAAPGVPRVATMKLQSALLPRWMWTDFCWSTTPSGLWDSNHCASCHETRRWCWV